MFNSSKNHYILAVGVFIILVLFVFLAWAYVRESIRINSLQKFNSRSEFLQKTIESQFQEYNGVVYELRSLLSTIESWDYKKWHNFIATAEFNERYPQIFNYGYLHRVPVSGWSASRSVNEIISDNTLLFFGEKLTIKESQNAFDKYVLRYIFPVTTEMRPVIGIDVASLPERVVAIQKARDINDITVISNLASRVNQEKIFGLYLPVYNKLMPIETIEQRQNAIKGVVSIAVYSERLFDNYKDLIPGMIYEVYEETATGGNALVYSNRSKEIDLLQDDVPGFLNFGKEGNIKFGDSDLKIRFEVSNETYNWSDKYSHWAVLIVGILISLFVSVIIYNFASAYPFFITVMSNISSELQKSYQTSLKYSNLVQTIDHAVIEIDLNSQIVSWNRGAEFIFGYSAEEAKNQKISLISSLKSQEELKVIFSELVLGKNFYDFEVFLQNKQGQNLKVWIDAVPLRDHQNDIIGGTLVISKTKPLAALAAKA